MPEVDHAAEREARRLKVSRKYVAQHIWEYCREHCMSLDSERAIAVILKGFDTADKAITARATEMASMLGKLKKQCAELRAQVKARDNELGELNVKLASLETTISVVPATEQQLERVTLLANKVDETCVEDATVAES